MILKIYLLVLLSLLSRTGAQNYTYQTKYFTVPVDHFSFANNNTFQLRYLINKDHWDVNSGPIFFYTGNEGNIKMFAENTGFMWDIAPDFNAMVVFAEHRYYGESLPFGNLSYTTPQHLGYLTSMQALADFVDLITFLNTAPNNNHHVVQKNNPVIAFGGSYGGMLSAWLRMKYPFIVNGAVASSAPILQFSGLTPCGAYSRIVTSDFNTAHTPECVKCIRKSWREIRDIAATDDGKEWLTSEWNLCNPLKTQQDVDSFILGVSDIYGNLAMINYPYPTNFLNPVPAFPIRVLCMKLQNSALAGKKLVSAVQKGISIFTNYTGQLKCLDVESSSGSRLGQKGWSFQACTEIVMPMCSDGENDMFEKKAWKFSSYSDNCFKKWGVRPQLTLAVSEYGGKNLYGYSNIIFTNGLLDPWSAGGVLRNISRTVLSILIPEGAHHLDLRGSHSGDPPSVKQARNFIKQTIYSWIKKHHLSKRSKY